jgi:hypothetical protein
LLFYKICGDKAKDKNLRIKTKQEKYLILSSSPMGGVHLPIAVIFIIFNPLPSNLHR